MVAGARNHLQADRPLEFRFEIVICLLRVAEEVVVAEAAACWLNLSVGLSLPAMWAARRRTLEGMRR
jgi:hypothetical protein